MRERAGQIMERSQPGIDVFFRGAPEPLVIEKQREYADTLMDLLKAYAERRARKMVRQTYTVKRQPVWSIKEAREALERPWAQWTTGAPSTAGWSAIWPRRNCAAGARLQFPTASLELVREGVLELRQDEVFQPIYGRRVAAWRL
ncbi:MAG: hypothetical protein U1E15_07620 [Hyphomicrobiales bacterium]